MMGKLIMRLFHARTAAHVLHLKSRSYSQHKALNEFYDEVVGFADTLAESYQGEYGLIDDYGVPYKAYDDPMPMLEDLVEWIEDHRDECCDGEDTHIQNVIDEVVTLIRSTQYKLRFLK
jgi:hypothetical protein